MLQGVETRLFLKFVLFNLPSLPYSFVKPVKQVNHNFLSFLKSASSARVPKFPSSARVPKYLSSVRVSRVPKCPSALSAQVPLECPSGPSTRKVL